jgi:hypothetical protein
VHSHITTAMGIGETITVINKSGKVVKSASTPLSIKIYITPTDPSQSKHIVNVFKEAQSAYRERKAEIKAERDAAAVQEKQARDRVKALRLDDDTRSQASHRSTRSKSAKAHRTSRPPLERGFTDSFYANDPRRFNQDLAGDAQEGHAQELVRRKSDDRSSRPRKKSIDMDLAYGDLPGGELPPPLPGKKYDDAELREKASTLTKLLDEANCVQHSVTATIENLQNNPDALAAVALTLAEISAILGKMGPGVLLSFKGAFPAVVALLASPQFMIAAGVGVGVTIVALGGFKIIKKLQAQKEDKRVMEEPFVQQAEPQASKAQTQIEESPEAFAGLDELEPPELGRIELWRRGIADVQAGSGATSVDGEFMTPGASKLFVQEGVLDADDIKSRRSAKSRKDKDAKSHKSAKSSKPPKSSVSVRTSTTAKPPKTEKSSKPPKSSVSQSSKPPKSSVSRSSTMKEKREKEPSLLKSIFRSQTMAAH